MHCLHLPVSIRTTNKPISGIYIERLADAQKKQNSISQVGLIGIRPVNVKTLFGILRHGKSIPKTRVEHEPSVTKVDWNWFGYDKRRGKGAVIYANSMLDLFEEYRSKYGEPDILHAHSGRGAGLAALIIKSIYGIPYVITEHNPAYIWGGLEGERHQLEVVYGGAERIYGVSEGMYEGIRQFTEKRPRTFPNVIDDVFVEQRVCEPTEDNLYFLSVGRFDDNKNQELAIEAVKKVNNHSELSVTLKLAGKGKKLDEKKDFAKRIGANEYVEFLGFVDGDKLSQLYSNSVATLICSKQESFGLPIIESMATGTPVVATPTVGSESISSKVMCGLYLTERNANAFADQMEKMFDITKNDRHKIAKTVIDHYSKDAVGKLSAEEYASVLGDSESFEHEDGTANHAAKDQ